MGLELFVIGDSISLHYGPYLERFVAGSLAYRRKETEQVMLADLAEGLPTYLDYPHGPFGENAGDSGMVLEYLSSKPTAIGAAVVLLNCGLHDLKVDRSSGKHQVPLDTYRENLAGIVDLLAQIPVRLVWCTTTPIEDATHAEMGAGLSFSRTQSDVERYNAAASDLMKAASVPIVDLHGLTQALGVDDGLADLYVDHAHFKPWVRAAQGAFLAGWLRAMFTPDAFRPGR